MTILRLTGAAALLLCLLLSSCPGGRAGGKPGTKLPPAQSWTNPDQEHEAGLALSLFRDTPMAVNPPDAISFSRDCSLLWVRGMDRESNEFYVGQFEVGEDSLTPLPVQVRGPDLIVSYAQASPTGEECLVLSQWQPKGATVRDVIYRVGEEFGSSLKFRSGVPWEQLDGIPMDLNETTYLFTKPFYSWDGATILIPFNNDSGIGVMEKRTGGGTYVPYPRTEITGGWTGNAFGPLPDEDGTQRIWASFWRIGTQEDECAIYTLDLQTLKWERMFQTDWAIYNVAVGSPSVDRWLAAGSFSSLLSDDPQAVEIPRSGPRIPRLALLVPGSGEVDLLSVYSDPVWNFALDPHGTRAFFPDFRRKALVRLNPANGELDFDPRWFTAEDKVAKLFTSTGADRCFIWRSELLIEADFRQHEDEQGYDE